MEPNVACLLLTILLYERGGYCTHRGLCDDRSIKALCTISDQLGKYRCYFLPDSVNRILHLERPAPNLFGCKLTADR